MKSLVPPHRIIESNVKKKTGQEKHQMPEQRETKNGSAEGNQGTSCVYSASGGGNCGVPETGHHRTYV